jgi:hypothetical protein
VTLPLDAWEEDARKIANGVALELAHSRDTAEWWQLSEIEMSLQCVLRRLDMTRRWEKKRIEDERKEHFGGQ